MIKGIVGNGSVTVSNGYAIYPSFPMNMNNPLNGVVRYNTNTASMETFDGSTWRTIGAEVPIVSLSPDAEITLAWARKKMEDEAYILGLSNDYPAIKDLLDQLDNIKHKIDMVVALVKQESKV